MQYKITVPWDASLVNVLTLPTINPDSPFNGLATEAVKITTGAPSNSTTAGFFIPAAIIKNAISGIDYSNTGTIASPVWLALESSASDFTLPVAETDAATATTTSFDLIFSALTSGIGQKLTGSGAIMTANGAVQEIAMGAATLGTAQRIINTGAFVGLLGIRSLTANLAATSVLDIITATGLTAGIAQKIVLAAATLTTGRYVSYNDGALEVFGVGANGHLHTAQTTPPTIGAVTANGITAAAVTAGSSDTAMQITTTGTQDNVAASVIPVAFGKTYTVAPKSIQLTALNAAGANGTSLPYVSAISATGFSISVTPSATAGATPSWMATVIA